MEGHRGDASSCGAGARTQRKLRQSSGGWGGTPSMCSVLHFDFRITHFRKCFASAMPAPGAPQQPRNRPRPQLHPVPCCILSHARFFDRDCSTGRNSPHWNCRLVLVCYNFCSSRVERLPERGTSGSVQRGPANPARPGREQRYRDHLVCPRSPEVPRTGNIRRSAVTSHSFNSHHLENLRTDSLSIPFKKRQTKK